MTNVLSQEAAERIWKAHREIATAKKLLAEVETALKEGREPSPIDRRGPWPVFTLGRGGYDRWTHIAEVSPRVALAVIEAHIAAKELELTQESIAARIELEHKPND